MGRLSLQLAKTAAHDEIINSPRLQLKHSGVKRLRVKVGRGQGDRDIGTRVWGLGTWERETRD